MGVSNETGQQQQPSPDEIAAADAARRIRKAEKKAYVSWRASIDLLNSLCRAKAAALTAAEPNGLNTDEVDRPKKRKKVSLAYLNFPV